MFVSRLYTLIAPGLFKQWLLHSHKCLSQSCSSHDDGQKNGQNEYFWSFCFSSRYYCNEYCW